MSDIDTVYVGNKPPMAYVMALLTAFNNQGAHDVALKARGRTISRAVDVAEITRNRYLKDLKVKRIELGTEQMPVEGGGTRGVSTISITLSKNETVAEVPREPEVKAPEEVKAEPEVTAPEKQKAEEYKPKAATKPTTKTVKLSEVKGVGEVTEAKLKEAGFKTANALAKADPEKLSKKADISSKVAAKLVESAKTLIK